jgi:hypothetical protein
MPTVDGASWAITHVTRSNCLYPVGGRPNSFGLERRHERGGRVAECLESHAPQGRPPAVPEFGDTHAGAAAEKGCSRACACHRRTPLGRMIAHFRRRSSFGARGLAGGRPRCHSSGVWTAVPHVLAARLLPLTGTHRFGRAMPAREGDGGHSGREDERRHRVSAPVDDLPGHRRCGRAAVARGGRPFGRSSRGRRGAEDERRQCCPDHPLDKPSWSTMDSGTSATRTP